MRRRWGGPLLALLLTIALGACAGGSTAARPGGGFRVGLVTDVGKVDDKSFNQSVWEGVQSAQRDVPGVTEVKYIETTDPKDYEKNIAQFADANYDVVVTVGFALSDATYAAAKNIPEHQLHRRRPVPGAGRPAPDWPLPNLVGITFDDDKAGFLAGALAAAMTKSGTVGAVLGTTPCRPCTASARAIRAGAKSRESGGQRGRRLPQRRRLDKTFSDPEWGKTTAQAQIDRGVDVDLRRGRQDGQRRA